MTTRSTETAQHTPGPWEVENRPSAIMPTDEPFPFVIGPDGQHVAFIDAWLNGSPDAALNDANARLIAAAPDLLSALEGLRELAPMCWDLPDCGHDTCIAARAADKAISKATERA